MATARSRAPAAEKKAEDGKQNGQLERQPVDLIDLTPLRTLVRIPTLDHPVDGEVYEMRLVDDFGVEVQPKLLAWSKRYTSLFTKASNGEDLDEKELAQLRFTLDAVFEHVLQHADGSPLSKTERARISDHGRQRVMTGFTWGPTLEAQRIQSAAFDRLVAKGYLKQEQLDEVMREIQQELLERLSTSES